MRIDAPKWKNLVKLTRNKLSNILLFFSLAPLVANVFSSNKLPPSFLEAILRLENYVVGLTFVAIAIIVTKLFAPNEISDYKHSTEYYENYIKNLSSESRDVIFKALQNNNRLSGHSVDAVDQKTVAGEYFDLVNESQWFFRWLVIIALSVGCLIISLNYIFNVYEFLGNWFGRVWLDLKVWHASLGAF